jgi:uracil phosphoribosyltransferase
LVGRITEIWYDGRMTQERWTLLRHNLATHKLTRMRERTTKPDRFRRLMDELGLLLCSEMTRDLELTPMSSITEHGPFDGNVCNQSEMAIMPILRAGLPLGDAFAEFLPNARIGHIGIYRDKKDKHHCYLLSIPKAKVSLIFVLDPMITQGIASALAVDYLMDNGIPADNIRFGCFIASRVGLEHFYSDENRHKVRVYTFSDTEELNSNNFLMPGLGNVSDRVFQTGE